MSTPSTEVFVSKCPSLITGVKAPWKNDWSRAGGKKIQVKHRAPWGMVSVICQGHKRQRKTKELSQIG